MPDGSINQSRAEAAADRKLRQREEREMIIEGLRRSAASLAERLLRRPDRITGHDYRYGKSGVMRVTVTGPKAGQWHDYASGEHGDMLKLIRREGGLNFVHAMDYARDFLGMPQPDYARPMTRDERKSIAQRLREMERERAKLDAEAERQIEARQMQVAGRAQRLWDGYAASPAPTSHPYVRKKGIDADGLRVNRRGVLLIPVRGPDGRMQTLQRIWPNGDKRGLLGGRMKGGFHVLGEVTPTRPVIFCEGVATGKSIHASTGLPVVVTFSAGNMREVMRAWRDRNPSQLMLVAGDNDHQKPRMVPPKSNVGAELAERMRAEVGAVPVLPEFAPDDPGKDWNDVAKARGSEAVREPFLHAIAAAAAAKESIMPDGTTPAAPADASVTAAQPIDLRQVLREAVTVEGVVGLGIRPDAAASAAKTFVAGLSDDQVRTTLDGAAGKGWVMRSDGSLDAEATATNLKAAAKLPEAGKEAAEASAADAPSTALPKNARRILTEAMALEGVAMGMGERASVDLARGSVGAMPDDQVRSILNSATDRGWVMRPDGSLDASATLAGVRAVSASAGAAKSVQQPETDPLRAVVERMGQQTEALRAKDPKLAATIETLASRTGQAGALQHEGLRSRIAYAVMDYERTTGTRLEIPEDLRRELEGRMVSYPGLTNPRGQALMRQTATMASLDLIREVRRTIADIVKGGPQDTPDVADRMDVLERKIGILVEPAPVAEALKVVPPAPGGEAPARSSASPGPGVQPDAKPIYQGQGGAAAQSPQPPQQDQGQAVAGRKTLANYLLSRTKTAPSEGHPPWERVTSGLADRLEQFEQGLSDRRVTRIVEDTELAARNARRSVEHFVSGPGRGLMEKIETAAARDPAGMAGVMSEMRAGGRHEALRAEFDARMKESHFAKAYHGAVKGLGAYGEARVRQQAEFQRQGIDPAKAAALDKVDSTLGEEASRMPGLEAGKNALQELASKVAEVLREGMTKIRNAITGAVATVGAAVSTHSPSPSP